MPFRRVRGCRRKQRKALCGSASVAGKPWSGAPLMNVPMLITDNSFFAVPTNTIASTSLLLPNMVLFTEAAQVQPIDCAPSPSNHSITLFRADQRFSQDAIVGNIPAHFFPSSHATGMTRWRDVDDDGISDYNETHYSEAYPRLVRWANDKSAETDGEFNATEYLSNQFNPFVAENIPPMILDFGGRGPKTLK